jgi:hypothetical protein
LETIHYHRISQLHQILHHTIIHRCLGPPTLLLPSSLESTILLYISLLPTLCRCPAIANLQLQSFWYPAIISAGTVLEWTLISSLLWTMYFT